MPTKSNHFKIISSWFRNPMEEESSYSIQEAESSFDSDTESEEEDQHEDDDEAERAPNPFKRWKKVNVAVSSDTPVWIGIEVERDINMGGQKINLDAAGVVGFGLERSVREHHLVSHIPWVKGNAHE